jgi:hypothetical protein
VEEVGSRKAACRFLTPGTAGTLTVGQTPEPPRYPKLSFGGVQQEQSAGGRDVRMHYLRSCLLATKETKRPNRVLIMGNFGERYEQGPY